MADKTRVLIVGLGNELLQDDGVGVHIARELQKLELPGVRIVEVGTAVIQVLDDLEWADCVLGLDAMHAGGNPGDLYLVERDDLHEVNSPLSLHDLELLAVVRFLEPSKIPMIKLLGVEPSVIDYGLEPTEPVTRAIPRAINLAIQAIDDWLTPPIRDSDRRKTQNLLPSIQIVS